jgi:oligoribonuclease
MANDKMVWVDVETTGLVASIGTILEVGLVITDVEGKLLSQWKSLVNNVDHFGRDDVEDVVRDMHDKSGLWEDLDKMYAGEGEALYPNEVTQRAIAWLRGHDIPISSAPMCGSTINFDRTWLQTHMPLLHDYFHYRNVDVTTLKNLCKMVNPSVAEHIPAKAEKHRVLQDLDDSIREYQFYLENFLFVQLPE